MAVRERSPKPVRLPGRIVITAGIHSDTGTEKYEPPPREQRQGAANDTRPLVGNDTGGRSDLTIADVGTFNGFGSSRIPQRSFIRAWVDENPEFIQDTLQKQMALVVAGKLTAEKAAARIALAFEGSMKQRISRGVPPPNAPSTIARKGSSKPLIDTGQLRNAIRARAVVEEQTSDGSGSGSGETGSGEAAAE